VPVVGRLALRLTAWPAAAVAAAWVVAVDPTFVCFAPVLASEHLFAVLLMAAMLVALEAADAAQLEGAAPPSTSMFVNVAVAGTLLGAAALARADAIFYAPIVVVVLWRGAGRRVVAPAACLLAAAMVLTPWYVRNRLVIGPGAGLSTAGGLTFYYGHNSRAYGWHPLEGTPLEGLDEAALQTRGYQLGFAYLAHAGWGQIVSDIEKGTRAQYLPSYPFSFIWATRSAGGTPDETSQRALPGYDTLYGFADGAYQYLMWGAGLSLLFVRRYPRRASFVLYGMVVVNWTAHCVVFLGEARYRYPAEVACCVLFALFALEAFTTMQRIVPAVVRMSRR